MIHSLILLFLPVLILVIVEDFFFFFGAVITTVEIRTIMSINCMHMVEILILLLLQVTVEQTLKQPHTIFDRNVDRFQRCHL